MAPICQFIKKGLPGASRLKTASMKLTKSSAACVFPSTIDY